jgi:hypothetical protein
MLTKDDFKGAGVPALSEEGRMRTKIIRPTIAGGVPVAPGQVVDIPEREARFLAAIGKAELLDAPVIETADAPPEQLESTDIKPPKKRK